MVTVMRAEGSKFIINLVDKYIFYIVYKIFTNYRRSKKSIYF